MKRRQGMMGFRMVLEEPQAFLQSIALVNAPFFIRRRDQRHQSAKEPLLSFFGAEILEASTLQHPRTSYLQARLHCTTLDHGYI